LEVKPITGRSHQIRAQLAGIGCPILGDVKYGFDSPNPDGRSINLHAKNLEFVHPVKKKMLKVSAPLPDDEFWKSFLKFDI
jgi:23S rRNA pseudouridine1911/1915/1917 synthase